MAIPLPGPIGDTLGQGIDSGFSGVNQLLQPYFNRKMQQAQQQRMAEQFQKEQAMRQEQQQRLAQQFQQDFALRQQGEQRKGSLMPLQEQLLQQKINAQRPEYMAQQAKEFMNAFGGPEAMNNPIMKGLLKHNFGIDLEGRPLQGAARNAMDLKRLKDQEGEGSEVYQNAKAEYDSNLQSKKDLSLVRDRTLSGLKSGERWIKNPETGENIGIEHNLSEKERSREIGRTFFNELYPIVYKGSSPFSGTGSIEKLQEVASKYNTNPEARKLFDDYLLSKKALTATVVNEAATLDSGKTNQGYNNLRQSLMSSDIPKVIDKLIREYKIPASAELNASKRFQELINKSQDKANKMVSPTRKLYFNPEEQFKEKNKPQEKNDSYHDEEMVIVDGPNGEETMTYAQAKKLGAK